MALTNPTLSNATTTSLDCAVDSDIAGGTLYYLVSTAAAPVLRPTDCVRFGQAQVAVSGTNNLGTWTDGIFPIATGNQKTGGSFGDFRDRNNYAQSYRLFVVHDPLDDGNYTPISVSGALSTLNDNEMYAPSDTTRFLDRGQESISRDDPLIQEWLDSGGNVVSDDRSSLPASLGTGQYTVTFTNNASSVPNVARTLTIAPARKKTGIRPKFTSLLKTDSSNLADASEFWGTYKFGNYLFCAKGTVNTPGDHGGLRVFDVSDVEGGSADVPVFTDTTRGPDENPLEVNRFLRTVQVKGTPGTAGAEAYVLWRNSPYTNTDRDSMIYVYDIGDANPANWGLRSNWAQSHQYLGGPGTPARSAPLLSDMTYDGSHIYASVQRSGVRKYDPADLSTPVINDNYTPRQHETQGNTVDSDPNGFMYIAAYGYGLRIVNKSDMTDNQYSSLTTHYSTAANSSSGEQTRIRPWDAVLSKDENWLFCSMQSGDPAGTSTTSGMAVFDVHDPKKPLLVGINELPVGDQDVFNGRHDQATVRSTLLASNGREYLMCGNLKRGVAMWDVSDPTRPVYMGTHTANLDTVGGTIDGMAHVETWEDNGKLYAAYGDYGSLTNQYGSRQLYIDELTLEGNMSFVIGVSDYLNAGSNTALNAANGTKTAGQDAAHWHTASAGDYIDQVTIRIAAPGLRVTRFALYTVSGGVPDQFVNSWAVTSNSGETRDSYSTYPLGEQYALQDGVTYTIAAVRDDAVSGGTNTGIISAAPDVAFSGQNGTADGTAADGVFQNPYGGSPAVADVIAMAFLGDNAGGGAGLKPPLASNQSFKIGKNQDKKNIVQATADPDTGADEVAIWAAATVDISKRQAVVGTFRALYRYAMNNLSSLSGSVILSGPVGVTNGGIQVGGSPTSDDVRLEIGSNIIDNGESGAITESYRQLEAAWLEASTGN